MTDKTSKRLTTKLVVREIIVFLLLPALLFLAIAPLSTARHHDNARIVEIIEQGERTVSAGGPFTRQRAPSIKVKAVLPNLHYTTKTFPTWRRDDFAVGDQLPVVIVQSIFGWELEQEVQRWEVIDE